MKLPMKPPMKLPLKPPMKPPLTSRARAALVVMVLALATSTAAADLEELVSDLEKSRTNAVREYLAECLTLVWEDGSVRDPCRLELKDLVGDHPGPVTLKVSRQASHAFPRSSYSWREAEVTARAGKKVIATWRVIELVSYGGPPDAPTRPVAVHWSRPVKDKDALARAGTRPALPAITGRLKAPPGLAGARPTAREDWESMARDIQSELAREGDLKTAIASWLDDGAVVLGSAPGERLAGAKGRAAVKKWKLALVVERGADIAGVGGSLGWGVVRVTGTTAGPKPVRITYTLFLVRTGLLTGGGGWGAQTGLVAFSVAP